MTICWYFHAYVVLQVETYIMLRQHSMPNNAKFGIKFYTAQQQQKHCVNYTHHFFIQGNVHHYKD